MSINNQENRTLVLSIGQHTKIIIRSCTVKIIHQLISPQIRVADPDPHSIRPLDPPGLGMRIRLRNAYLASECGSGIATVLKNLEPKLKFIIGQVHF